MASVVIVVLANPTSMPALNEADADPYMWWEVELVPVFSEPCSAALAWSEVNSDP